MSEKIVGVDRAIDVLQLMYDNFDEMGVSEISRALGLGKSTIHRILATLEARGMVYRNIETNRYWLGRKIYLMGLAVGEKMDPNVIIKKFMQEFYEKFNEVINISMLDTGIHGDYISVVVLKESNPEKVLTVDPKIGSTTPAHASAVGKCLLAHSPLVDMDRLLKSDLHSFTEHTITEPKRLEKELAIIREKGYAMDDEEREYGLTCIGAPILNKDGNAEYALSISGATASISEGMDEKVEAVKNYARKIARALYW